MVRPSNSRVESWFVFFADRDRPNTNPAGRRANATVLREAAPSENVDLPGADVRSESEEAHIDTFIRSHTKGPWILTVGPVDIPRSLTSNIVPHRHHDNSRPVGTQPLEESENLQQLGIDSSAKDTTTDTVIPLSSTYDTDRHWLWTEQRTVVLGSDEKKWDRDNVMEETERGSQRLNKTTTTGLAATVGRSVRQGEVQGGVCGRSVEWEKC